MITIGFPLRLSMALSAALLGLSATATHAQPSLSMKRVALVFDDGPRAADAEPLLAFFAKEHVHVTFSLVGDRVTESPDTVKKIDAAGHEIVNHSQTHAHPRDLTDAALEREVVGTQEKIRQTLGRSPRWYWPPFIEIDPRLRAAAARAKLTIYEPRKLVASMDYDTTVNAQEIFRHATTGIDDGTVILFHEWRKETLQQLPAILAELRKQNCVFLTFSELYTAITPRPGAAVVAPKSGTDLPQVISAKEKRIQYSGRVDFTDPTAPVIIWQGTKIDFEFTGDRVALEFGQATDQNYFEVEVDGQKSFVAVPASASSFFEFTSTDKSAKHHHLTLFKRSEAAAGYVQFKGVRLTKGASLTKFTPATYKSKMLFVGDSITVGACNEDGEEDQWNDRSTHNFAKSYASLTAATFSAEHRAIAVSGMGIVIGYVDVKAGLTWDKLYPKIGSPPAELASWQPDVVFVNLGENDGSYTKVNNLPFPADEFTTGYVALIRAVRTAYPRAHVVLLRGGMQNGHENPGLLTSWGRAINELEASDSMVSHYVFKHWTLTHPRVSDDQAMADELVAWLKPKDFMARLQ